jgi:phosphatidylglycerol lysyltransferase
LETFKTKFQPENWEPVYAIANERTFSPLMLYAVAAAFSQGSPVALLLRALVKASGTEFRWLFEKLKRGRR